MPTEINAVAPVLPGVAVSIRTLRNQRAILDSDLAALYGVEIKRFNEQIKRNLGRFPTDFMFQLTAEEFESLRSQFATLKRGRGQHRKYLPYAFNEHGAIMAAMVLGSDRAIEVSVHVVRAFVQLRQAAATHTDLAQRLTDLEMKVEGLEIKTDAFAHNSRKQLRQIFEALQALTQPPDPPKRAIGFILPPDAPAPAK
jgi:phage regulator Rha-like protein